MGTYFIQGVRIPSVVVRQLLSRQNVGAGRQAGAGIRCVPMVRQQWTEELTLLPHYIGGAVLVM